MIIGVGDTVRVIETDLVDEFRGIKVGDEFEVVKIMFDLEHPIIVRVRDDMDYPEHPLGMEQLELVKQKDPR